MAEESPNITEDDVNLPELDAGNISGVDRDRKEDEKSLQEIRKELTRTLESSVNNIAGAESSDPDQQVDATYVEPVQDPYKMMIDEVNLPELDEGNMSGVDRDRKEDEKSLQEVRKELTRTLESSVNNIAGAESSDPDQQVDATYVEPVQDPYKKAIKYLEKHNILQLFQAMTTNIVYQRPENPVDFMIGEIEEMKKAREHSASSAKTGANA